MPQGTGNGGTNPNIHHSGTNAAGNSYTNYNNGAYRYKWEILDIEHIFSFSLKNFPHSNTNAAGESSSNYYNTGKGHSFYRSNGPEGYNFHENANQGFRSYSSNKK